MSLRPVTSLFAATFLLATPALGENLTIDSDWHFWFAGTGAVPEAGWLQADPTGAHPVDLPHSWNPGRGADADGIGWYSRDLTLPAAMAGEHVELHFGAVFYKARIWVNGVAAGTHEGGHTAFDVDISKLIHGGANRIVVAADNRPGIATIPGYAMRLQASGNVWYDWWRNGGITRDVSLRIADGGLIRRQIVREQFDGDHAVARSRVLVENVDTRPRRFKLRADLLDPAGKAVAQGIASVAIAAGGKVEPEVALAVDHPQLWNIGDGRLYRLDLTLLDEKEQEIDRQSTSVGFRRIEIRDRKLLVNGVAVRLTGVSRHEDSPWEGAAETRGTVLKDFRDLETLHVTLTRPIHYPQPQTVFDEADKAGMLLIPEIPIWQMTAAQLGDPRLLDLAKRMMAEVVAESGNHPSILAWSIMNECDSSSPQGGAFVTAMKRYLNDIDPGRLVTFADADISIRPTPRTAALSAADFIMANAYFGTWSGAAHAVSSWLDSFERTYPDKMLVISEFGWPGPFSADKRQADADRTDNLRDQMGAFAKRAYIAGAVFWDYQDYRSNKNLFAGETDGYVDHGLVDADRQRKPSFAAWENLNRPVDARIDWQMRDGKVAGFHATLSAPTAGSLPSYPLIGYRVRWRAMAGDRQPVGIGEQALPLLGVGGVPQATIDGHWVSGSMPVHLQLEILTPLGLPAASAALDYLPFKAGSAPFSPEASELPQETRR